VLQRLIPEALGGASGIFFKVCTVFFEILFVFFACHAFCGTACKKPAKQLAGGIFNPALFFAVARLDWADISRGVGALLRMSALRTLMVVLLSCLRRLLRTAKKRPLFFLC
jgi:hypothetical protein